MGWSLPAVGLLLAVVLGLSLGQHLAQLKLVQDAEVCAVLAAVAFTSHGKGKGFSLLPCSAGVPWGGIGLSCCSGFAAGSWPINRDTPALGHPAPCKLRLLP